MYTASSVSACHCWQTVFDEISYTKVHVSIPTCVFVVRLRLAERERRERYWAGMGNRLNSYHGY